MENNVETASFAEYISKGIEDKITDFTNNGACSCCGGCCARILPVNKKRTTNNKKIYQGSQN